MIREIISILLDKQCRNMILLTIMATGFTMATIYALCAIGYIFEMPTK